MKEKIIVEENEVISQLLCKLVKPNFKPPLPNTSFNETLIKEKETQLKMDSIQFGVSLFDSLIIPPDKQYFKNIDLPFEYKNIYNNFKNNSFKSRPIDFKFISLKCNYIIYKSSVFKSEIYKNKIPGNFIGIVCFSRVSFNSDFSKACFYMHIIRGRLSGDGIIVFVFKQKNKWDIFKIQNVWVS